MTLKYFSDPKLLSQLHRNILVRLLDDYKEHLPAEAATLLRADLEHRQFLSHEAFCAAWAAQFNSPSRFGAPLLGALLAIEDLARLENAPLLKDALSHLPPGYFVNENLPSLHQALHLWIIAQNTPGVSFPLSPPSLLRPPSLDNRQSPISPIENSVDSASGIENQNSKFKNPVSSGPSIEKHQSPIENSLNSVPALEIQNSTIENCQNPAAEHSGPAPAKNRQSETSEIVNPSNQSSMLQAPCSDIAAGDNGPAPAVRNQKSKIKDSPIKLPDIEPWPEPILDIADILCQVSARYSLYAVLPEGAADAKALWTAHAHAVQAFHQSPRLNLQSIKSGAGKTTCLDVLATMTPRPLRTENLRAAVLFRLVDQCQPTLLLDEVDTYLPQSEELRGLINAGHKRGSCAYRCEGEGNAVRSFKAYAPAVLAGIGPLPATIHDRSIVIPLLPAEDGAIAQRFDPLHVETEITLARKLARWAKDNFHALSTCKPTLPPGAFNRLADNWRPLLAIAQLAGGGWPARALNAFTKLTPKSRSEADLSQMLLSDIRTIFAQAATDRLFTRAIIDSLCALPQRPWTQLPCSNHGSVYLNEHRLARHLAAFGVRSQTLRIGHHRAKGYSLLDLTPAFSRILDTK